ncbi:MAG: hypothetical protein J6N19_18105, partial [Clostridium sp.]|nr:hypothetical protein [Clostridium sp.]
MEEDVLVKKRIVALLIVLCVTALLCACGKGKTADTASKVEPTGQEATVQSEQQEEAAAGNGVLISEDQAFQAVLNYCKAADPDFDSGTNSSEYSEYWDVSTNEDGMIVVLYRSYTAAQTRYYIDPISGEAYVTEMVPGVIDDEQKTGETFNVRNYLAGPEQPNEATAAEESASAPVEYETADGFMSSFLLASNRDQIGTTNDYGVFYRVVYKASL